jgi:hypothetical protein
MDNTAPAQVLEMRLIQYRRAGQICAALVRDVETVQMLGIQDGTYGLAQRAVQEDRLGTSTLSFADGIRTVENDEFEISASSFGRPLRNSLHFVPDEGHVAVHQI